MSEHGNKAVDKYVGHRVRERRKAIGLTQAALAEAIGISHQQVQRYESGENPLSLARALEIANILNVKPEFFYEGVPTNSADDEAPDGIIKKDQSRPLKITLIEDTLTDENLFRKAVAHCALPCTLTVIQTPEKVIPTLKELASKTPPDLPDIILLDINMPRINGLALLKEIKKNNAFKQIPVIMLTNSVRSKDLLDSYSLHANGFIQKSSDLEKFYADVDQFIRYWNQTITLTNAA